MHTNGFRGSSLPGSRRIAPLEVVQRVARSATSGSKGVTNDGLLADHLARFGPSELNLVVVNKGARTETDLALQNVLDLFDLVVLRTTHGREPGTFAKELMPGIFMTPTAVQTSIGEYGIQDAIERLLEGVDTYGPRPLTAPAEGHGSPMMWLISAGDTRQGESLYRQMDTTYRPHRHMWSHHERPGEDLHWAILVQLSDAEIDAVFPTLRTEPGYAQYVERSDRALANLTPQTGIIHG